MKNNLHRIRTELGLNKKQMAEKLGLVYTTYVGYENGNREPNSEVLIDMSKKLGVSIDYILAVEELPVQTVAAHFDGEEYTDEELEEIRKFAEFVRSRRTHS